MKRILLVALTLCLLMCLPSCKSEKKVALIPQNKVALIPQNFDDFFKVESSVEVSGGEDAPAFTEYDRTTEVSYTIKPFIPLQVDQKIKVTFSIGSSEHPEHYKTITSTCVITKDGTGSGTVSFFDRTKPGYSYNRFGDAVFEIESVSGYVLLDPEIYQSLQMKQ